MTTLKDIMTTNVDFCTAEDNVFEAAVKMKEENVGVIPVLENNHLIGVITDRDIVIRCVAEKRPNSTKITDVITTHLVTGTPDMSVDEAEELMASKQVRRLPIVEHDKLVGVVALGDLAVHRQTRGEAGMALSSISENRDQIQH
jgi:CBS domain-containing protein